MNKQNLYAIETLAAQAWPAQIEEKYEAWILRANAGVTKRANSVYTLGNIPQSTSWQQEMEAYYSKLAIAPCFYISELSPPGLDDHLAAQGYEKTGEMFIMQQSCAAVQTQHKYRVQVEQEASPTWITQFLQLEGFSADSYTAYETIFSNITLHKAFMSLYKGKTVVALGTIVIKDDKGYLSNIVVDARFRRQGIARILIQELANYAYEQAVESLFLQVLQDNTPAIGLYKKIGFRRVASSHYRMKSKSSIT